AAEQGATSGALAPAFYASHYDLYAGEFPHGAERGAPHGPEAIRRDLDDHRDAVSHGIPKRRWHCTGVYSGRSVDPHPLSRTHTARGPGRMPHAKRDARDENDPRKLREIRQGRGR